jgi:hypothetical protein
MRSPCRATIRGGWRLLLAILAWALLASCINSAAGGGGWSPGVDPDSGRGVPPRADVEGGGRVDAGSSPTPTCGEQAIGASIGMQVASGTTAGRSSAYRGSCGGEMAGESTVWWVAPTSGSYTIDTRGSSYDTLAYVRQGSCDGPEVACDDDFVDGVERHSEFVLDAVAGVPYLLVIDGFEAASGEWVLNITPGRRSDAGLPLDAGVRTDVGVRADIGVRVDAGVPGFDPCRGIDDRGRCASLSRVQYCSASTGNGTRQLITEDCTGGETCRMDSSGFAGCAPAPSACVAGSSECLDASTTRYCANGTWRTETCANRCVPSPVGSGCNAVRDTTTRVLTVTYEARRPRTDYRDWGDAFVAQAQGFLVLSIRGTQIVDAQYTNGSGVVQLQVPASVTTADRVVVTTIGVEGSPPRVVYMVADPALPAGQRRISETNATTLQPRVWNWSWPAMALPSTLRITEATGSGAARVFDYLRYSYNEARRLGGRPGRSLVAWVGNGVSWSCGACFSSLPVVISSQRMQAQTWLDGNAVDQGYWSDPVTAHELGHWVMASFGTSPNEGGAHTVGVPTFPGQAWSEGWATFVSSHVRQSPRYYDKQRGSMFWFDIGTRTYGSEVWPPLPSTLLGRIDENEVAAILWRLGGSDPAPLYAALQSQRMNLNPFGRCYTRMLWCPGSGGPSQACDTFESTPHLADMLDALNCRGTSRTTLSAAMGRYPYPVNAPFCTAGEYAPSCVFSDYPYCRASSPPSCL